ncbi:ribosome silencing factor [Candidatus Rhabdochlamydia porcellionis]|jgi:ribosome-associated protein|uniref:Ribosomal silencing factor RsfS n=1 Tax=Candidatus Rhabdochlamydia porcellionis TaxID=225148 RepID=A0ABX8Z376_9BACT|nr:ribosome silencing factor [Candidatus Rhabdochlamydia porcellionis]QZA58511.1 Ribosomal silencing factor RsfS [Candidatus Rhabdochlamydia porcellionis]
MNIQEIPPYLNQIAQIIFDKKGSNILALDIRGISSLADFVIIAEGNVDKHVSAIASTIVDELKKVGFKPSYVEGLQNGDWAVIDYLDTMVHIFEPGLRERYRLEELWNKGAIIDLKINIESDKQA